MRLRHFAETKNQIIFEVVENNTSTTKGKELIVVNLEGDPIQVFKKQLVADLLDMFVQEDKCTDWKEIDRMVEQIMNCKVHWL